jgi:hypothetical protein
MIYLASPYTHPDPAIRQQRFNAACCAAATLVLNGQLVYAPVVHGHPLAPYYVPTDWAFWEPHARWHIERCDEVVVFTMDGWETSVGVQKEIEMANALCKPVRYHAPLGLRHNTGWHRPPTNA